MSRIKAITITELASAIPVSGEAKRFKSKNGLVFNRIVTIGIVESVKTNEKYATVVLSEGDSMITMFGFDEQRVALETLPQGALVMVNAYVKLSKKKGEDDERKIYLSPILIREVDGDFLDFWQAGILRSRQMAGIDFPIDPFKQFLERHGLSTTVTKDGFAKIIKGDEPKIERVTKVAKTEKKARKPKKKKPDVESIEDYLRQLQEKQETFSYADLLAWGAEHGQTDAMIEAEIIRLMDEGKITESEEDRNVFILNF